MRKAGTLIQSEREDLDVVEVIDGQVRKQVVKVLAQRFNRHDSFATRSSHAREVADVCTDIDEGICRAPGGLQEPRFVWLEDARLHRRTTHEFESEWRRDGSLPMELPEVTSLSVGVGKQRNPLCLLAK
jgi:hypothetical protein